MKRAYVERERRVKKRLGNNIYREWGAMGGGKILKHLNETGRLEAIKREMSKRHR